MKRRYSIHLIRAGKPNPVNAIAKHDAAIDAAETLAKGTRLEVKVWDRQTGRCIYTVPAVALQEVA